MKLCGEIYFLITKKNDRYEFTLIDLDKIVFGSDIDNEKAIVGSLLNSNSIFYKIIMNLKGTFSSIINYTDVSDKLFWTENFTVDYIMQLYF